MSLRKKVAIVGYGDSALGRVPGKSAIELCVEACKKAIDDSGLPKEEIDGFLCSTFLPPPLNCTMIQYEICEHMGLFPRFASEVCAAGTTHTALIEHAVHAIASGEVNNVLCVSADNLLSRGSDAAVAAMAGLSLTDYELPYGAFIVPLYALIAKRYMHEYGVTSEQLARIAVIQRKHASMNPDAQMREPITVDDVLNSKMVCDPLHLLDCALISDGGGAVIVTSAENAKKLKVPPVYLLGLGFGFSHCSIMTASDLMTTPAKISGEAAFRMAGLKPKDIDFAEIYDAFTSVVLMELEDLGFCKKGEAGKLAEEEGRLEIGGELPINTHGGKLSCAHPGISGGFLDITEAVRQLRGEAGERQVKNAEIGLVHAQGGFQSEMQTLIMGR